MVSMPSALAISSTRSGSSSIISRLKCPVGIFRPLAPRLLLQLRDLGLVGIERAVALDRLVAGVREHPERVLSGGKFREL